MEFLGERLFESSFDRFARGYHDIRPSYPDSMFAELSRHANITPQTRILEIGAGSGIATTKLANLGAQVTALEPGAQLLAIAREQLGDRTNVTLVQSTFEAFETSARYDVILAATAFHWIASDRKFRLASDLLTDNGILALAWNTFCHSPDQVAQRIAAVFSRHFGHDAGDANVKAIRKLMAREAELLADGTFYVDSLIRFVTPWEFDAKAYCQLLMTFPNVLRLAPPAAAAFIGDITTAVSTEHVTLPIMTSLYVCRKVHELTPLLARRALSGSGTGSRERA